MEKITKEYEVYRYDELSDEVKEKICQNFGTCECEVQCQTDMLEEDFTYQLEEKYPYFENPQFAWSLSCCQGDGLSFKCDINLEKYLDIHHKDMKNSVKYALINAIYNLHSDGNNGRYCYCSESDIDYEYNYYHRDFPKLYALLDDIILEIKQQYCDICSDFEKQGYSAYEYLYSDEYARETSESNEYKFLENGEIFS